MTSPVRVRYQTIEVGHKDIHLCTLRDNQQFSDPDGVAEQLGISSATWPLFGVVWPSSLVLANHMLDYDIAGKRILEVGCGIGLSSILLNKRNADITATDYHPKVEHFLNRNAKLNNGKAIAFERVDWADENCDLGLFDLIIGSDILYEPNHAELLAGLIGRVAKPKSKVLISCPGRGHKNNFSRHMEKLGYLLTEQRVPFTAGEKAPFKGRLLSYQREA